MTVVRTRHSALESAWRRGVVTISAVVALPAVTSAQVIRPIRADTQRIKVALEPARTVVVRRTPIPFRPFDSVDATSGRRLRLDSVVTLPNGKRLTMRQLLAEANRVERQLNTRGFSLRDTTTLEVERLSVDKARFRAQVDLQRRNTRPIGSLPTPAQRAARRRAIAGPQRLSAQDIQRMDPAMYQSLQNPTPARLTIKAKLPSPAAVTRPALGSLLAYKLQEQAPSSTASVDTTDSWEWSIGDDDIASFSLGQNLASKTSLSSVGLAYGAYLKTSILGYSKSLIDASASVTAPANGTATAESSFEMMGNVITTYSEQPSITESTTWEKSWPSGVPMPTLHFEYPVWCLVACIDVSLKVSGNLGFDTDVSVVSRGATLQAIPTAYVAVRGEASVDAIVVEVGAGAEIKLFGGYLYGDLENTVCNSATAFGPCAATRTLASLGSTTTSGTVQAAPRTSTGSNCVTTNCVAIPKSVSTTAPGGPPPSTAWRSLALGGSMSSGGGRAYVWAKVYYPCWSDGLCHDRYEKTIIDWDGFEVPAGHFRPLIRGALSLTP